MAFVLGCSIVSVGCDQMNPAGVCASAETQRAIRQLIADDALVSAAALGRESVDPYGDRLVLEQITLEGFDRTLNRVDCAGSFEGLDVRITYTRQPNHSETGTHLYGVGDISPYEAGILLRTLSR